MMANAGPNRKKRIPIIQAMSFFIIFPLLFLLRNFLIIITTFIKEPNKFNLNLKACNHSPITFL